MKIKEALNFINATTTVRAKVNGDYLNIFSKDMISDNWFLKLNTNEVNWDTVLKHWGGLTDVAPEDLARAMDVIQRLLDTPVEERFPEKSYRLVAKRKPDRLGLPRYVKAMNTGFDEFNFYLTDDKSEAGIYKESVLEGIKKCEPSLAPAIDAMKKEVKDDED